MHGLYFDTCKGRRLNLKRKFLGVSFTKKFILKI